MRPEGKETAAHSSESCCGKAKDTLAFPRGHLSWEATDAQTSLASKPFAQLMGTSYRRQNNTRQCVFQQELEPEVLWALSREKVCWKRELDLKGHNEVGEEAGKKGNDTGPVYPGNTFLPTEKQIT